MFVYQNQKYSSILEIKRKYNFLSASDIMKTCGIGFTFFKENLHKLNIVPEKILRQPSNRIAEYYTQNDLKKIIAFIPTEKKDDSVPPGYLNKTEFAELLNIKKTTLNNMASYYEDFNKYSTYFYVNNVKIKFFSSSPESIEFYKAKLKDFTTPFSERHKERDRILFDNTREYEDWNIHKVAFDYGIFNELFDTNSNYFRILMTIYRKYAKLQIADSAKMDNHHIIPRFYESYNHTEDLENTIYLPREVHLLVHILEYRCAFPDYKTKFFTALCILSTRIDASKLDDNILNEVTKSLIKILDIC